MPLEMLVNNLPPAAPACTRIVSGHPPSVLREVLNAARPARAAALLCSIPPAAANNTPRSPNKMGNNHA